MLLQITSKGVSKDFENRPGLSHLRWDYADTFFVIRASRQQGSRRTIDLRVCPEDTISMKGR